MLERLKERNRPGTGQTSGPLRERLERLLGNPSAMIVGNAVIQAVLRLVSNIILARLLAPAAFALTSIVLLILTGIQMISDLGIGVLALRNGAMEGEREAKLWTLNLTRGIALALVILLSSEPVAWLYGMPELGNVMRVLSLMPALQGAQSLYPVLSLARRDMVPTLVVDVAGRIGGTLLSIGVALVTPTVWALVAGTLAQFVISVAVSHSMSGRWPRFHLDIEFVRSQWHFSRWIQLSSTFTFVAMQADKAIFPFLFGLSTFGLYTIGATFAAMPAQITLRWASGVFFPLAVQLLHKGEPARANLRRIRFTMLLYTAIVTIAVMAGSPAFFSLLYKQTYHDAARFAQLLAAGTFVEVAELSLRHFPLADNTSRFEVIAVVFRLFVFLCLAVSVYVTSGSAQDYAISYVAGITAGYLLMLVVCVRRQYLRPGPDLLILLPVLAAFLIAFFVSTPSLGSSETVIYSLIICSVVGALMTLVYLGRGLPSLPRVTPDEMLRLEGKREVGELPTRV